MASARSSLLNFITRIAMRLIFRGRRPVTEYRGVMERLDRRVVRALPASIVIEDVEWPVSGRWLRHTRPRSSQTILYLHGGAFIMRLPQQHTPMVAAICDAAGCSAFMAWYRLAPEHPFPAAPEDCLAAYRALLESGHQPQDIVIMGDSAGGNLVLSLLHLVRKAGLPMPGGAVALSPVADLAQISATWRMNKWRDPMYRVQGFVNPVEHYLQGASPIDPVASPYYGDYRGFPPLLLIVGGIEALLDDSVGIVRKAIDAGVPAKLHIWCGMPHVFTLQHILPETRLAIGEIAGWLWGLHAADAEPQPLYRSCVEVFDLRPFTGRLVRETNDVYLMLPPLPSPTGLAA